MFFSHILLNFFRDWQRSNAINGSNIASYGLYFDGIDDIDDDDEHVGDFDDVDEEHVGDFDAFSPGHSQYLAFSPGRSQYRAFSLDGNGLGGPGDKGRYPLRSIDFRFIYSFTRSMSYHS